MEFRIHYTLPDGSDDSTVVEPPWGDGGTATVHSWSKGFKGSDSCDRFAFAAYAMADAMLEARTQ